MQIANEPSRREFLGAAIGATAVLATTHVIGPTQAEEPGKGFIDAHSHIWTRDVERYPLRAGQTLKDLDPPSFTTEELLATAKPQGVDRVVLIAHTVYYGFDNRYMTDAAKEHPGVFKVVGMVDDSKPHPDAAMRELLPQQVTGFRITPRVRRDAHWLDNPGMKLMWKAAADTGQAMCCLIDPQNLGEVDQMCADFPETNVVIDHFARIGVDGQIRDSDLQQLCDLSRHPHTFVKISAYYALGQKRPPYDDLVPMIKRLYETFGPQRLMWASDAPYQLVGDNNYPASIALIRDRIDFVTPEDRQWLLRRTAEKVFFFA